MSETSSQRHAPEFSFAPLDQSRESSVSCHLAGMGGKLALRCGKLFGRVLPALCPQFNVGCRNRRAVKLQTYGAAPLLPPLSGREKAIVGMSRPPLSETDYLVHPIDSVTLATDQSSNP